MKKIILLLSSLYSYSSIAADVNSIEFYANEDAIDILNADYSGFKKGIATFNSDTLTKTDLGVLNRKTYLICDWDKKPCYMSMITDEYRYKDFNIFFAGVMKDFGKPHSITTSRAGNEEATWVFDNATISLEVTSNKSYSKSTIIMYTPGTKSK